jgi:hypothetical protein
MFLYRFSHSFSLRRESKNYVSYNLLFHKWENLTVEKLSKFMENRKDSL